MPDGRQAPDCLALFERRFRLRMTSITMNGYSAFGFKMRRFNATRCLRWVVVDLLKSSALTGQSMCTSSFSSEFAPLTFLNLNTE
jgi:hypothetical protein